MMEEQKTTVGTYYFDSLGFPVFSNPAAEAAYHEVPTEPEYMNDPHNYPQYVKPGDAA